jgi:hypothetical protein
VPRVISSSLTFFYKFVFPSIWIAGFGVGTITVLLVRPRDFPWPIFPVFWVFGSVAIYWSCCRLKKVSIDAGGLVISNYLREIHVPWRSISEATGSRVINPPHITITFDHDIGIGTSIIFIPGIRLLWPFQEHPAAQELRDLILANRDRQRGAFP